MGPDEIYDPYCGNCERAQEDYNELEAITEDLTALVVRLAIALRKSSPDHDLPRKALDYLGNKGLRGSVLR